jgi:hypothetical protein
MKPKWYTVLFGLALWAQLVFGTSMTLWRDSLILFSDWQPNAVNVPNELNGFAELAARTIPPRDSVALLSQGSDEYTVEYVWLAVRLYPRRIWWLGMGPITSPINRWTPVDLYDLNWVREVRDRGIHYVLIVDLADAVPCQDNCIQFDTTRYLWVIK